MCQTFVELKNARNTGNTEILEILKTTWLLNLFLTKKQNEKNKRIDFFSDGIEVMCGKSAEMKVINFPVDFTPTAVQIKTHQQCACVDPHVDASNLHSIIATS